VDSDGTPRSLSVAAGTGDVIFNTKVGSASPRSSLSVSSSKNIAVEDVATVGAGGISFTASNTIVVGGDGATVDFNSETGERPWSPSPPKPMRNSMIRWSSPGARQPSPSRSLLTSQGSAENPAQREWLGGEDLSFGDDDLGGGSRLGDILLTNIRNLTAGASSITARSLVYTNYGTGTAEFKGPGAGDYSQIGGLVVTTSGAITVANAVTTSFTKAGHARIDRRLLSCRRRFRASRRLMATSA